MDCLLIGHNDMDFPSYVQMIRVMADPGARQDLELAFVEESSVPLRALDVLTQLAPELCRDGRSLHNMDFFSPTLAYLGSYLHRRGFRCGFHNLFQFDQALLRAKLRTDKPRAIAVTTTFYVSPQPILEVVAFIRKHAPETAVIVGGSFIHNHAETDAPEALMELFEYLGADAYVVDAEGEAALAEVLSVLRDGGDVARIPNVSARRDGRFVPPERRPESNSLADNGADYGLFPKNVWGEFMSVRTAKSCPFACAFCGFPRRAGKYVHLSVAEVERELNAVRALEQITTLTFLDDSFNVPARRFKELLRMMIRNRYGFHWNSFFRCDFGDDETVALMREAGCEGVFLGVESGSDALLQNMNKTARRKHYLEMIPKLRAAGISTHANLIVGFPGETTQTFRETLDLIEESRPDYYRAQLWYYDPASPIARQSQAYRLMGAGFNWTHADLDAETACGLVEDAFRSVRNSTWLPQAGFEQWATFYLQRRGLTAAQVKAFVQSFNAAVLEKRTNPGRNLSIQAKEALRRSIGAASPTAVAASDDEPEAFAFELGDKSS